MESKKRTLAKTAVYRGLVTILLFALLLVFTHNIYETSLVTIIFNVGATIIYYIHERMWSRITWESAIKPKRVLTN